MTTEKVKNVDSHAFELKATGVNHLGIKKMKLASLFFAFLLTSLLNAQTITYTPSFVSNLSDTVFESSGLIYVNQTLWTHNDSGGKNEIYQIDTLTGFVKRKVIIKNTTNIDWEDLAQSSTHIYIGEFGNNSGNRTDLRIYKITNADLLNPLNDSIYADTIKFNFSDQTVFTNTLNTNNYDCEAFLFLNDSLHLFSKSWVTKNTRHYILPATIGNNVAQLVDSFNVNGLITSADINKVNGNIVMLGYEKVGFNYNCFAWLFYNYTGRDFFNSNKIQLDLGYASIMGQTEGIIIKNDNKGYFSSERIVSGFDTIPSQLYEFDFNTFFTTTDLAESINTSDAISIFPNPAKNSINISGISYYKENILRLVTLTGQIVFETLISSNEIKINPSLQKGLYELTIKGNDDNIIYSKKVIIE